MQRLKKDATSVASATLATIYMERIPILVLENKSIAIDGKIFMYPHIARITHTANKLTNIYNPRTKRNYIVYDAKKATIVYDRYLLGCHIVGVYQGSARFTNVEDLENCWSCWMSSTSTEKEFTTGNR